MSITKFILVIGFCVINTTLQAQDSTAILGAKKLLQDAKALSSNQDYRSSDSLLILARSVFQNNLDWDNWFLSISRSNANAIKERRYQSYLDSLIKFEKQINQDSTFIKAKFHFKQALNHQYIGNIYESIRLFKSTISLLDDSRISYGNTKQFKSYYKIALKNIANGFSKYNDQSSALNYITLYEEFADNSVDSCKCLKLRGQYLFHDEQYYESYLAYAIARNVCKNSSVEARLATLLIRLDSLGAAERILDQMAISGDQSVNYYIAKTSLFKSQDDLEKAISTQIKTLDLIKADSYYSLRTLAKESILLAQLYDDIGDIDKANQIAHQVLSYYDENLVESEVYERPIIEFDLPDIWIIEAHYIKAKYFRSMYMKEPSKQLLDEAVYYYQKLFDYFDLLKNEYNSSNSKYRMGVYGQEMYNDVIGFYIDLYLDNGNIEYQNAAFKLTQQSNAFVLKNAISERRYLQMIGLSQDSIDQYLNLIHKLSQQEDMLSSNELMKVDAFRQSIYNSNSQKLQLSNKEELSIEEVQSTLTNDDLLLQYKYAGNNINLFAISKTKANLYHIEVPQGFENSIDEHMNLLSNPQLWSPEAFVANGNYLYQVLLKEVLESNDFIGLSHLYIIPNGLIRNVAFSALITEEKSTLKASDYLIWDYSLSYLYYCEQLSQPDISENDKDGFIGFGLKYTDEFLEEIKENIQLEYNNNGVDTRSASLYPLNYAVEEVLNCGSVFEGKVYLDDQATVSTAFNELKNHNLIHISAHALVDKENYFNSHVILNRGDALDYKLTYEDVIKLQVDADFVVLSACQTGIGDMISGEGQMSLCRAFVQSGSKSVMGTYWNASDRSSSEMMSIFYKHLSNGVPKAKALQLTQKEFLTNDQISSPRVRAPFYWASWAIYGENIPYQNRFIPIYKQLNVYIYSLICMLFIFLSYRYFKRFARH